MGWSISIGLLIAGFVSKNTDFIIAAGLFAVSGSISIWLNQVAKAIKDSKSTNEKSE